MEGYSQRVRRLRRAAFVLVVAGPPIWIASPLILALIRSGGVAVPSVIGLVGPAALLAGGVCFGLGVAMERREIIRRTLPEDEAGT